MTVEQAVAFLSFWAKLGLLLLLAQYSVTTVAKRFGHCPPTEDPQDPSPVYAEEHTAFLAIIGLFSLFGPRWLLGTQSVLAGVGVSFLMVCLWLTAFFTLLWVMFELDRVRHPLRWFYLGSGGCALIVLSPCAAVGYYVFRCGAVTFPR